MNNTHAGKADIKQDQKGPMRVGGNEKAMCGPDTAAMAISKKMKSEGRAERERKRTDREYSGVYSASTDSY